MNRITFLTLLVLVLLLINSITLFFLFRNKRGHEGRKPQPGMLYKKLDLDKEQQQQFEQLRQAHFKMRDSLRIADEQTRKQMILMLETGITDSIKVDSLTNLLLANRREFEVNMFRHFQQVYSILNAEQRKKFSPMLEQIMKRQMPASPGNK